MQQTRLYNSSQDGKTGTRPQKTLRRAKEKSHPISHIFSSYWIFLKMNNIPLISSKKWGK
jgi:hypothetical protein